MHATRAALLIGVCLAAAACADQSTENPITGPGVETALDVHAGEGITDLGTGEVITLSSHSSADRAATGARASGHAGITIGGASQHKYSFTALSTVTGAKGQFEGTIVTPSSTTEIHAEVSCLRVVGNQAWVSGPIRRFVVNGEERPVTFHVLVKVADNGEGAKSPPDMASPIFGARPQGCRTSFFLLMFRSEEGNIQVRQR